MMCSCSEEKGLEGIGGFAVIVTDPRDRLFHDLSKEERQHWGSKLRQQSLKALAEGGEHAYAAWMEAPSWYLAITQDRGLPVEVQRMLVQVAKDAGGEVTLREIESNHSPTLSKLEETADFIMEAAVYFVEQKE